MDRTLEDEKKYQFKSTYWFPDLFLRCGVCLRFLTVPPIHVSAVTGIKICGRCFRADRYFRCQRDIDEAKLEHNELYEKFAKIFLFQCSYSKCEKYVKFGEHAEEHEETCEHKQYRCPVSTANRWYLRNGDKECNKLFKEEKDMIEHIENDHIDYVLPGPCLHFRYVFLPYERRRMFVLITEGKLAVLFSRKMDDAFCVLRCRTFPSEVPNTCEITVKDLQTGDCIRQRTIECGPLDGNDDDEVEQVFSITLSILPARTMFYFNVKGDEEEPKREDSGDSDDMANGFILI